MDALEQRLVVSRPVRQRGRQVSDAQLRGTTGSVRAGTVGSAKTTPLPRRDASRARWSSPVTAQTTARHGAATRVRVQPRRTSPAVCRSAGQSSLGSRCAMNSGLNSDSSCFSPSSATTIWRAARGRSGVDVHDNESRIQKRAASQQHESRKGQRQPRRRSISNLKRKILGGRHVAVRRLDASLQRDIGHACE